MHQTHRNHIRIFFTRRDGLKVTDTAELELYLTTQEAIFTVCHGSDGDAHEERALGLLNKAMSKWIEETNEGRDAWESSCGDLNIGDIATYQHDTDPTLTPYLEAQGISIKRVEVMGANNSLPFDTVLAHPEID